MEWTINDLQQWERQGMEQNIANRIIRLSLNDNQLTTLPESISNLTNLQHLELRMNDLTTLPESIGNLSNLQHLNIELNFLSRLPESIMNLTNLEVLNLGTNELSTLPESIGNLTNLRTLYLKSNELSTLPESIGNLTNLRTLNLNNNQLTTLPESIGNLTNLRTLYLNNNQLRTLPESIGNLTNLQRLNIVNNLITMLPESIRNLTNLINNLEQEIQQQRQQPLQTQPGIAFEIHNAFENINIDDINNFFKEKIPEDKIQDFQTMNYNEFMNFIIKIYIDNFLTELNEPIPLKSVNYYPENIKSWKDIWDFLYNERISKLVIDNKYKTIIGLTLLYISIQSKPFKENYVLAYLKDVAFAYDTGNEFVRNFSCGKGMIERFITSLVPAIDAIETLPIEETKGQEEETITNEKLKEYKILRGKLKGGFDEDVAITLLMQWQDNPNNKNIILKTDGSFNENKIQLIEQQKQKLIEFLCCELTITEKKLLDNTNIKNRIEYIFSDDNIQDYTLGGKKTRKNKRVKKYKSMKYKRKNTKKYKTRKYKRKLNKTNKK
jgi:Leucine-rich repeat (LRR) protein